MAGSAPGSIYEVFTMGEIILRMTTHSRPWEIHRFETISVVHFLN